MGRTKDTECLECLAGGLILSSFFFFFLEIANISSAILCIIKSEAKLQLESITGVKKSAGPRSGPGDLWVWT